MLGCAWVNNKIVFAQILRNIQVHHALAPLHFRSIDYLQGEPHLLEYIHAIGDGKPEIVVMLTRRIRILAWWRIWKMNQQIGIAGGKRTTCYLGRNDLFP